MALGLLLVLATAPEIWVAPNGDDGAVGTARAPMRTPARAIERARQAHVHRIVLRGGENRSTESLQVGPQDSGLTIVNAPRERPMLTGGVRIAATEVRTVTDPAILARIPDDARAKVRCIDLSRYAKTLLPAANAYGFTVPIRPGPIALYADSKPYIAARWPNEGYAKVATVLETGGGEDDAKDLNRTPKFSGVDRAKRWANAADVWLYGYWMYDWADEAIRAKSIDGRTGVVTLERSHHFGLKVGAEFFAENLLEELDRPGESYVDRATGTLYFIPIGPSTMHATFLDAPLLDVRGAKNVTIHGADFAFSRGDGATVRDSENVRFEACRFYGLGMRAATIDGGSRCGAIGCDAWNLGEGGFSLSGGDRKTLTPAGHYVDNCDVHDYQLRTQTYRPAVQIAGVGQIVRRSALHDAPHSAIIFTGNDHVIELNEFYRTVNHTGDGGVVYTGRDWTARGTEIRDNYFHDCVGIHQWECTIYFDDLASGLTARRNLIERCHWGFLVGGGRDNVLEDNVIVDCKLGMQCDARGVGWYAKNRPIMMERLTATPYQVDPWKSRYPRLVDILNQDPMKPKGNLLRGNVLVRSGTALARTEAPFKESAIYANNFETNAIGDWRKLAGRTITRTHFGTVPDALRNELPKR